MPIKNYLGTTSFPPKGLIQSEKEYILLVTLVQ